MINTDTEIFLKSIDKISIVLKQSLYFWLLIVFLELGFLRRVKSMQMESAQRHTHTHAVPLYYTGILLFN